MPQNRDALKHVLVTGYSGAGKSTLARQVAEELGLPLHRIDKDPRWESYDEFYSDMGDRPEGMTLDRIDNTKGYWKGNCRWATPTEQQNNRRCNHRIEFRGENLTLTEWAQRMGITATTLAMRFKYGWVLDRAMTTDGYRKKRAALRAALENETELTG